MVPKFFLSLALTGPGKPAKRFRTTMQPKATLPIFGGRIGWTAPARAWGLSSLRGGIDFRFPGFDLSFRGGHGERRL